MVAAAVSPELGSHGNGGTEEEKGIECVQRQRQDGMTGERIVEGDGYQVEKRKHREHGDEHVVIDERGVSFKSGRNDVAHQGHDEESP